MKLLRNTLILAVFASAFTACQSQPLSFASMSEEELYAYNLDKPVLQQVVCVEEKTTSSYIRKRRCQSLQQIITSRSTVDMQLEVLNYGYNYNSGIGRSLD